MFSNEEDLKNKVLLPFLKDLGFNPSEISFERNFSIKLGKSTHQIKNSQRSGRLDILCHRDGRNLFLIEAKADHIKITDEDINQGISYARLLDNIAPFVIVTNGKETIVVDSITKMKLNGHTISSQSDFWKNDCTLTADDINIKYEALLNFISYSDRNLKIFSEAQKKRRMNTLLGYDKDFDAKYNESLHVPRINLRSSFEEFIKSNYSVFALLGESGVGKTNAVCDLCINESKKTINLFYNGSLLSNSIIENIGNDFNLFFSSIVQKEKILPTINGVAKRLNIIIILFIDAIDEIQIPNFRHELSSFCLNISELENIKLCISCKSSLWNYFITINGEKSYLHDLVFRSGIQNNTQKDPGFILKRFNDNELSEAIEKFFNIYNIQGNLSPFLQEDLRHGLFLHIFCQVFSNKPIPSQIPFQLLLEKYLSYKIKRIDQYNREIIIEILLTIGKMLIDHESNSKVFEAVLLSEIKRELGLKVTESLPEELFSHNFLIKQEKNSEFILSFYYSRLRDFVITNYSYRLDNLKDDEFESIIPDFFKGNIGLSSIHFYYQQAKQSHRSILNKHKKFRLINYLESYNDYLDTNFYNTKESFDPYTKEQIGMVIPKDLSTYHGAYALYPIVESENLPDKFIEVDNFSPFQENDIFLNYNVRTIHGSFINLIKDDINSNVKRSVFSQLKKIIENQELNEMNSTCLITEKIVHIIYSYHKELGYEYSINDSFYPRMDVLYPIDLKDVKQKIYKFYAKEYFIRENIKQQIQDGRIIVKNNSYSYSHNQLDWEEINENIKNATKNNIPISTPVSSGDFPPFVFLNECITNLMNKGIEILESHYLPTPDISISEISQQIKIRNGRKNWIPSIINAQFSMERMITYIDAFFKKVEQCYCDLIESCFPTLKDSLYFYSTIPHHYYVRYDHNNMNSWNLGFGYSKSKTGSYIVEYIDNDFSYADFKKYNVIAYHRSNIDQILKSDYNVAKMINGFNTSKVDEKLILRSWVYKFLKEDLQKYINEENIELDTNWI